MIKQEEIIKYIQDKIGVTPTIYTFPDQMAYQIHIPPLQPEGTSQSIVITATDLLYSNTVPFIIDTAIESWKKYNVIVNDVSGTMPHNYYLDPKSGLYTLYQSSTFKWWMEPIAAAEVDMPKKSKWVPKDMEELYRGPVCEKTGEAPVPKKGEDSFLKLKMLFEDAYDSKF